jgi:hypothetical protein
VPDQPVAFMSYVRFNDEHDDGQLTEFRGRLWWPSLLTDLLTEALTA